MKSTILTTTPGYNPFFANGKKIRNIIFTAKGEEVGRCNWFNNGGSNNNYYEVHLPFEAPFKRKHAPGKAYIIKEENVYNLYLPVELLQGVEFEDHVKGFSSLGCDYFFNYITFECVAVKKVFYRDELDRIRIKKGNEELQKIKVHIKTTSEDTKEGKEAQRLAQLAKERGLKEIDYDTAFHLLQHFNVTLK